MPCCAFAAFILAQILIGLDAIKRFALGRSHTPNDLPVNPSTEWRLIKDESSNRISPTPSKLRLRVGWIAAAASIEIALTIGGVYGLRSHLTHHHNTSPATGTTTFRISSSSQTR